MQSMTRAVAAGAAFMILTAVPATVAAGGFEVPARGARAAGRAGAFMARADQPMALWYNPALLSELEGFQLHVGQQFKTREACFERSGTYTGFAPGDGRTDRAFTTEAGQEVSNRTQFGTLGDFSDERFPKVCSNAEVMANINAVGSLRLTDTLGIGLGLVSPNGSSSSRWELEDHPGMVRNDQGQLRPSPSRYMRVNSDQVLLRMGLGIGWAPFSWLRIGGTFWNGFFVGNITNYTGIEGGERLTQDVRTELRDMKDFFIPGGTVSAHVIPHDSLDIGLSFFASDKIDADGNLTATVSDYGFQPNTVNVAGPGGTSLQTQENFPVNLQVPQPWKVNLGIRYAYRRNPRDRDAPDRDPMHNEVFDIELDVGYVLSDRVDTFDVDISCDGDTPCDPPGDAGPASGNEEPQPIVQQKIVSSGTSCPGEQEASRDVNGNPICINTQQRTAKDATIKKGFKDQLTVYLGGDWNVIQDRLALRAGVSYEGQGMDPQFVGVDFLPSQRLGLHFGLTVRAADFDFTASYAHIFTQPVVAEPNVAQGFPNSDRRARLESCPGDSACRPQVVSEPTSASAINNGKFTENWDIVSLAVSYHTDVYR